MTVLNVIRGDQQAYSITLTEGDGTALDLTGLDVTFMAKRHLQDLDADALITKTATDGIAVNVDPTTGLAVLTLTPDDTELLADADRLYWDLQVDDGLGDVRTPLRGKLVIAGDVTAGSSETS